MKINFLYHGGAVAASGYLTLPVQETMEIQGSASLPVLGGHASVHSPRFSHRNFFSFERAETHVVGSFSEKDKAFGTLATTTVDGINIMNVVTCDRLVARVTSKHPADGSEPSFIPLGSRFENLRIAGHKIEVELATDLFTEHHTWTRLAEAHASKQTVRDDLGKLSTGRLEKLPASGGMIACTLARNLEKLPGGLSRKDHGIYVPHFGTVYLGEYFVSAHMHRLLMLHVDLGCSVEGCYGAGGSDGNGSPPPKT
jgi:hypothetical protein